MIVRKAWNLRIVLWSLVLVACTSGPKQPPIGQQQKPAEDPELKLVANMISAVSDDIERLKQGGGKPSDLTHPLRKWADVLWQYHEVHPGTPASTKSADTAVRLYVYTGQADIAIKKLETFKAEDPAWEQMVAALFYAASNKGDNAFFITKIESVLQRASDKKARAALWLKLGEAYAKESQIERARAAFEAAAREAPESDYSKSALANIYEVTSLNVGQPAPQFKAKTIDGKSISLSDLKGKVILVDFWATWCPPCVAEFPMLKKLESRFAKRGFVIVGISMDLELKPVRDMVAKKGIQWPQVCDEKGLDGGLAKLFNVQGIPAQFVVDRDGNIAGKKFANHDELVEVVTKALSR